MHEVEAAPPNKLHEVAPYEKVRRHQCTRNILVRICDVAVPVAPRLGSYNGYPTVSVEMAGLGILS